MEPWSEHRSFAEVVSEQDPNDEETLNESNEEDEDKGEIEGGEEEEEEVEEEKQEEEEEKEEGEEDDSIVPIGQITTTELQNFTQELLEKDYNNVTPILTINHQGRTHARDTDDNAPEPLLTVPPAALSGPTVRAFLRLLNNYDPNVAAKEVVTDTEFREEAHFLNEVMETEVMKHTEDFLNTMGIIQHPLKDVLKEIWFTNYSRAGRSDGSSGFEHVFVGEIKNGKVSGLHNWLQFGHEEWDGDLDYKGIMRYIDLGDRGQVIKGNFEWMNERKPVGTLFVGTSPEFELALYTVCFLIKPDDNCQVLLNDKELNIKTHSLPWNHRLIGGAYPDI